eukprot:1161205-Pelagomonas_calceolata.AAC.5
MHAIIAAKICLHTRLGVQWHPVELNKPYGVTTAMTALRDHPEVDAFPIKREGGHKDCCCWMCGTLADSSEVPCSHPAFL